MGVILNIAAVVGLVMLIGLVISSIASEFSEF